MGIKHVIVFENITIVEWYFKCDYEDDIDIFDGVTISIFDAEPQFSFLGRSS